MGFFERARSIHFVNARVAGLDGVFASTLRVQGNQVAGLDAESHPNDVQVDLNGAYIFPGLINSHDHLEHNHYGRVKFREKYANASAWTEDMNPRLQSDPRLVEGKSKPLADKLFIGGLKNLLSGATTVAHHNPFYSQLRRSFPVRLVRDYGWAHSLYLQDGKAGANGEGGGNVQERYHSTRREYPFILHLAEGVDNAARAELQELDRLGALGANTVLIHGVGITLEDWVRITKTGAGLVWCPASNVFLLEKTVPIRSFLDSAGSESVALGTDSRLTGSRDLLEEMQMAREIGNVTPQEILGMVTANAARLLRISRAGKLSIGFPADLVIIPPLSDDPFEALLACVRKHVLLVMVNGQPRYGAVGMSEVFGACGVKAVPIRVDGEDKLLGYPFARQLQKCSIKEPGVD